MADLQDPKIGRRWTESQPEMGLPVRNPLKPRIAKKCRASDKLQGYFWCNFQFDTAQKEVSRWDHDPVIADCTRNSSLIFHHDFSIYFKRRNGNKKGFFTASGILAAKFFLGLKNNPLKRVTPPVGPPLHCKLVMVVMASTCHAFV